MSHVVIIVQQTILPPPGSQSAAHAEGGSAMTAEVTYTPSDGMSDAQIGNQVERIVRRLNKLADD
jgi:hypothetical protein